MAKVIVFANQKGGVAKTTTTGAFAAGLSAKGKAVLAIDLDPQANLSQATGADGKEFMGVFELLTGECSITDAIQNLGEFDVVASSNALATVDQALAGVGKEYRLKEALVGLENVYDYILIDTPPALGTLTINAFSAADEVIIPTITDGFSANGLVTLMAAIKSVQKYTNPGLKIAGIVISRYQARAKIAQEFDTYTEVVAKNNDCIVFNTHIRASVVIPEAQAGKKNLLDYKPDSGVVRDLEALVDEYLAAFAK